MTTTLLLNRHARAYQVESALEAGVDQEAALLVLWLRRAPAALRLAVAFGLRDARRKVAALETLL